MTFPKYIYPTVCPKCGSKNIDGCEGTTFDGLALGHLTNWCYACKTPDGKGYAWCTGLIEETEDTDHK
jgi:hypothetical protein